jgi:lysyl-tRNA synthetase class 2
VDDAFVRYAGCSAVEAVESDRFDQLLVERVEPELGWERPVFLHDYPAALASLARTRDDNPAIAERFELYIAGIELANGFSELTDPQQQRERFAGEIARAARHGVRHVMPEKFLAALETLPPCAGIALGLDRLLLLITGARSVAEVVLLAAEDL